jgi:hypothetical protein
MDNRHATTEPWVIRDLEVAAASLLFNAVPNDGSPPKPQTLHLDFSLILYRLHVECLVLIEALTDYELWIYPKSHLLMREFADLFEFDSATKEFRGTVQHNKEVAEAWARFQQKQHPVLFKAKAGQRILMDGLFVHAGAAAWLNPAENPAFRLHWYLVSDLSLFPEDRELVTYPLKNLTPGGTLTTTALAALFIDPRDYC